MWNKFRDGDREAFKTNYNEFIDVLFAYGSRITSNINSNRITRKLEWCNIRFQFLNRFNRSIQITGRLDMTKEQDELFKYLSNLSRIDFIKLNANNYVMKLKNNRETLTNFRFVQLPVESNLNIKNNSNL